MSFAVAAAMIFAMLDVASTISCSACSVAGSLLVSVTYSYVVSITSFACSRSCNRLLYKWPKTVRGRELSFLVGITF